MLYLGYQDVFIGSYSQTKSNVSDNDDDDDDRVGVNQSGRIKGFLK